MQITKNPIDARLLTIELDPMQSFTFRWDQMPNVNNRWHFHPEFELMYIQQGSGTLFIEDQMVSFCSGDVFLLGPDQQHYYRFDDLYFSRGGNRQVDVKVAHFREDLLGRNFLDLPENAELKQLLAQARQGLKLVGPKSPFMGKRMTAILNAKGGFRLLQFIRTLMELQGRK